MRKERLIFYIHVDSSTILIMKLISLIVLDSCTFVDLKGSVTANEDISQCFVLIWHHVINQK